VLKIANHYVSKIAFALLLVEIAIFIASAYLAPSIRFLSSQELGLSANEYYFSTALIFALIMVFSMTALGMYQPNHYEGIRSTLMRLMPSLGLGFVLVILVFYVLPELYVGRGVLGIMLLLSGVGVLLVRLLLLTSARARLLESRIMFVGAGALAQECAELVQNNPSYSHYHIVGYVPMPNEEHQVPAKDVLPVGKPLVEMANGYKASEIVVAVMNRRGGGFPIKELLDCKLAGVKVIDAATFFEREASQIRVDSLQPSWFVFGNGFEQGFVRAFFKRVFDLLVSLLIFVVTLPLTVITALWIYFEDRGPIFYQQERVGEDGNLFNVLKFRSMRVDAEKNGAPQWASKHDPRTTTIGRIIRKVRIDEIPQVINVLRGDMSFVGPRPERPFFVEQLCQEVPYYNMRHSIKPGITGLAQVRYPYGASMHDAVQKLQYDLYYVKNNSLFLDLLILFETLQVVLFGKGGR